MDPPALVKPFKYTPSSSSSSSQQSMFSNPSHVRCNNNTPSGCYQDVLFSTKLPGNDTNCAPDDTEISIFDAQRYFSENSNDVKRPDPMVPHDVLAVPRLSSVSSVEGYGRNFRTRSFHATPTASSEASWNSQTGLLVNRPGQIGVSMRNFGSDDGKRRSSSAARKWILGRKCCCTGKNSVQVKEIASDSDQGGPVLITNENLKSNYFYAKRESNRPTIALSNLSRRTTSITDDILEIHQHRNTSPEKKFQATDSPRQQRVSASGMAFVDGTTGFSFPILNPSSVSQSSNRVVIANPVINLPLEDPPRDSLEVFQPIRDSRPPSLDNPVIARGNFNPGSPIARDDDMCSDASSDLFEIESFSTQSTSYPTYRRRDSLDEASTFNPRRFAAANGLNLNTNATNQFGRRSLDEPPTPSVAATECYAPSEVSIDWSVTTAEGFDKASVSNFSLSASEFGSAALIRERNRVESANHGVKKKGNGNGGGSGLLLMSCRHEKAVSVGPQPVKCAPTATAAVAAEVPTIYPVQVGGGGRPPRANKTAMGSSHSARLSLAFAA